MNLGSFIGNQISITKSILSNVISGSKKAPHKRFFYSLDEFASMIYRDEELEKALRNASVGEIRTWRNGRYKKLANGRWELQDRSGNPVGKKRVDIRAGEGIAELVKDGNCINNIEKVFGDKVRRALMSYKGSGSELINRFLRTDGVSLDTFHENVKTECLDRIEQISIPFRSEITTLKKDYTVYRGIYAPKDDNRKFGALSNRAAFKELLDSLQDGDILEDKGFVSTTLSPNVLNTFADSNDQLDSNSYQLVIKLSKGQKALCLEREGENEEYEMLLPTNTKFKINAVVGHQIQCEVIEDEVEELQKGEDVKHPGKKHYEIVTVHGKNKLFERRMLVGSDKEYGKNKIKPVVPEAFSPMQGLTEREQKIEHDFYSYIKDNFSDVVDLALNKCKNTVDVDALRELSRDYCLNRTKNSRAVHEPSSWLAKELYEYLLENTKDNDVVFYGGGAGAGKSSGGKDDPSDIIYDSNLSSFKSAVQKIEQAKKHGKGIVIKFIYRQPYDSFVEGLIPRMLKQVKDFGTGRIVTISDFIGTHKGAWKTIQELIEKYKDDEKVDIHLIDNANGFGNAKEVGLDELSKKVYFADDLEEQLETATEKLRKDGTITTEQAESLIGEGKKGKLKREGKTFDSTNYRETKQPSAPERSYQIGEISEETGLQKFGEGDWRPVTQPSLAERKLRDRELNIYSTQAFDENHYFHQQTKSEQVLNELNAVHKAGFDNIDYVHVKKELDDLFGVKTESGFMDIEPYVSNPTNNPFGVPGVQENKERRVGFVVKYSIPNRHVDIHRFFFLDKNGKLAVEHAYLKLPTTLQKKGYGKRIISLYYDEYKKAGIKKITTLANDKVGGYAWPRYGFCVGKKELESYIKPMIRGQKIVSSGGVSYGKEVIDASTKERMIKAIDDHYSRYKDSGGQDESYMFPMRVIAGWKNEDGVNVGKKLLLGTNYYAFLDLNNARSKSVFESYISPHIETDSVIAQGISDMPKVIKSNSLFKHNVISSESTAIVSFKDAIKTMKKKGLTEENLFSTASSEDVDVFKIHPTVEEIKKVDLLQHLSKPEVPRAFKIKGKYFLLDGHEEVAGGVLKGLQKVKMKVYEIK